MEAIFYIVIMSILSIAFAADKKRNDRNNWYKARVRR